MRNRSLIDYIMGGLWTLFGEWCLIAAYYHFPEASYFLIIALVLMILIEAGVAAFCD